MSPKKYDMTYKKKAIFSYLHYGILVFAQGAWREKEKVSLEEKINQKKREGELPNLFRYTSPFNCDLCNQINDLFEEIKGKNDGIMYFAHENLELDEIKMFTNLIIDDEMVKKMYMFQGGPVERSKIGKEINLRERLTPKSCGKSEFVKILEDNEFQLEILYEITKDRYY